MDANHGEAPDALRGATADTRRLTSRRSLNPIFKTDRLIIALMAMYKEPLAREPHQSITFRTVDQAAFFLAALKKYFPKDWKVMDTSTPLNLVFSIPNAQPNVFTLSAEIA